MRLKEFITRSGGVITAIALLGSMMVVAGAVRDINVFKCSICGTDIYTTYSYSETGVHTYQEFYSVPDISGLSNTTYLDAAFGYEVYNYIGDYAYLIVAEYNGQKICQSCLEKKIAEYKAILADRKVLLSVVKKEIIEIRDKYGDERRTSIGYDEYDLSMEDLIPNENTIITMTKLGYIKRMTLDNFKSQHRGGKGIKGMQTIEDDYIEDLFMATTHHYLMFFTNKGRVYRLKAYEIPEASRTARGTAIINLLQLLPDEKITAVIPIREYQDQKYLFMATKKGIVKKTSIVEYANIRKTGLQAISLRDEDELIEVKVTNKKKDIILITKHGQCIRFNENDVRPTGRTSMGVIGMNLSYDDELIGMQLNTQGDCLMIVSEYGMGKKTDINEFGVQHRGGKGVKCYKITDKTGNVVNAKAVNDDNEVMLITTEGIIIQLKVSEISTLGRITSGVKLIDLDPEKDIVVASMAKVRDAIPEENGNSEEKLLEELQKEMDEEEK